MTVTLWSIAFPAIRVAARGLPAGSVSLLRLALASVVLALAAPLAGLRRPARRDLLRLLSTGASGMAAYQLLLTAGEQTVPAGTASILVNTGPIFVALLAVPVLGEMLTRRAWLGIAIGFTGAVTIVLGSAGTVSLSTGALLVLAAAMSQAVFFILQKHLLSRHTPFEVTAYATWLGTALLLPLAPAVPAELASAPASALLATAYLGIGASTIGFFAWAHANSRLHVSRASAILYLVPAAAILVGWAWLGEMPSALTVLGGAVALAGVALTRTAPPTRDQPAPTTRLSRPGSRNSDSRRNPMTGDALPACSSVARPATRLPEPQKHRRDDVAA